MAQPPEYTRQHSFSDYQTSNPSDPLPAAYLEAELNAVKATIDAIIANLALIQRDDGELANLSVGAEQLAVSLLAGVNPPVLWTVAPTSYVAGDTVVYLTASRSELWRVDTAHTSTTNFDEDAAAYMTQLGDFAAAANVAGTVTFDDAGRSFTADDVQAAIEALDNQKTDAARSLLALATTTLMRAYLGLEIGTDVQAQNAALDGIAGQVWSANRFPVATGPGTWSFANLSTYARTLIDDLSAGAARTTLGLGDIATTDLIDEDDMASDSAARAPSQQSVKAYVTAQLADIPGGIGADQTPQDMTESRSAGTAVQNTTGKPIWVAISHGTGTAVKTELSADNNTWVTVSQSNQGTQADVAYLIVPDDYYYKFSGATINKWTELR